MQEKEVKKPNNYDPLVFDFGNGIILDNNDNLSLDLVRLYGIAALPAYEITSADPKRASDLVKVTVKDGRYRIEKGTKLEEAGRISPTEIADDKLRDSIRVEADKLVDTKRNNLGMTFFSLLNQQTPTQASRPNLIGQTVIDLVEGNKVLVGGSLLLAHQGDRIEIGKITLVHAGDSYFIYDRSGKGYELRRVGNRVEQYLNGRLVRRYSFLVP